LDAATGKADKLRDKDGFLSPDSFICLNAAQRIQTLEIRIEAMKGPDHLNRIATVLEAVAVHGWGNVDVCQLVDS
jgi:hypothetical protein